MTAWDLWMIIVVISKMKKQDLLCNIFDRPNTFTLLSQFIFFSNSFSYGSYRICHQGLMISFHASNLWISIKIIVISLVSFSILSHTNLIFLAFSTNSLSILKRIFLFSFVNLVFLFMVLNLMMDSLELCVFVLLILWLHRNILLHLLTTNIVFSIFICVHNLNLCFWLTLRKDLLFFFRIIGILKRTWFF